MSFKTKGTITLNNNQVGIMLDYKDQIVDEMECQCDSHQPCFPHSREVCESCYVNIDAFEDELKRQEYDERDRGDWYHDEREGMLDDGQMFYNHHEANDGWFND